MGAFTVCVAVLAVLATCSATATTAGPRTMPKKCKGIECTETLASFRNTQCAPWELAKVVFQPYHPVQDNCCKIMKCYQDPEQPCGGKACKADTVDEATENCNIIYKDDEIWNNLQPEVGAMYATLRRPAINKKGRCCNEYKCHTNHTALCENKNVKNPCPDQTSCPVCHRFEIITAADPKSDQCCPEARCVEDPFCMCERRIALGVPCPEPTCHPEYQYPETVIPADPEQDQCCDVKKCADNMTAICTAEQAAVNFTEPTCVDECDYVKVTEAEDFAAGECFPKWDCPRVLSKCCGFDNSTCTKPTDFVTGECEYVQEVIPVDYEYGPCCPKFKVFPNHTCFCDAQNAAGACDVDEVGFKADNCPELENMVGGNRPDHWKVNTFPAIPEAGAGYCCPRYQCEKTAEGVLADMRAAKQTPKPQGTTNKP